MSTRLLIGLKPIWIILRLSQSGEELTVTFFIITEVILGTILKSGMIFISKLLTDFLIIIPGSLIVNLFPVIAEISLAIPTIDRRSGRFGVISNSRISPRGDFSILSTFRPISVSFHDNSLRESLKSTYSLSQSIGARIIKIGLKSLSPVW